MAPRGIRVWVSCLLLYISTTLSAQDLGETYISEWKKFYPSKALRSGMHETISQYANRSQEWITQWISYNEGILNTLASQNVALNPIDTRLLGVQAQSEVDRWKTLSQHRHSLQLYSQLIAKALPEVLQADFLLVPERARLMCQRLETIADLAQAARSNLTQISRQELDDGQEELGETLEYLENELLSRMPSGTFVTSCPEFELHHSRAVESIRSLQQFVSDTLAPKAQETSSVLGRDEYDRRLRLYTDSDLSAAKLAEMALSEIEAVKGIMLQVAEEYLMKTYPGKALPKGKLGTIKMALADMEKDAPKNGVEYLSFWQELAEAAKAFIVANDIATLPAHETLRIQTAPESAGPAARIGWVASAPPFAPNPVTTLYLPSIPETLPEQEQLDFWASFNKPFNRMIVIHELFPGHYMQLKISRETAHPLRLLFPYGPYIEGWATLTEKVLLDAGWEKDRPLTLLAHLRKRLENANRAFTSVQVHCNGWSKDQVMTFSTDTSLLAPQFAKSLWGRIMNSPMQLTSYFLGGAQFKALLEAEKKRLGTRFDLKLFMDTIMKAGPIPVDEFYPIFEKSIPN